jgi:hypothetical protein
MLEAQGLISPHQTRKVKTWMRDFLLPELLLD